jgi:hypothetical protein
MKKIIKILQRWFEHYGLVKIIAAFLILIICIVIDQKFRPIKLVEYIGIAAAIYLLITVVTFTIAGIVNSIKDFINRKKE